MSILLYSVFVLESLHPPGHLITATLLRTAVKEMHFSTDLVYVSLKPKFVGT